MKTLSEHVKTEIKSTFAVILLFAMIVFIAILMNPVSILK